MRLVAIALTLMLGCLSIPVHAGNVSSPPLVPKLGGAPTVTACGGGSPAVTGTDSGGMIQVGTGVIGTCTLNFSTTYSAAPSCTISPNVVLAVLAWTMTTSTMVITATSLTSVKIAFACVLP
jgi:hypothetical protein